MKYEGSDKETEVMTVIFHIIYISEVIDFSKPSVNDFLFKSLASQTGDL